MRATQVRSAVGRSPLVLLATVLALAAMVVCGLVMHATGTAHLHGSPAPVAAADAGPLGHAAHSASAPEGANASAPVVAADRQGDADGDPLGAHSAVGLACMLALLTALLLWPTAIHRDAPPALAEFVPRSIEPARSRTRRRALTLHELSISRC